VNASRHNTSFDTSVYADCVIKPMLATAAKSLPTGPEWTYEVKWDGYRTLAIKEGTAVRLISRNLNNISKQYPGVVQAVGAIEAKRAILDGELVAVDEHGRPSFQALQHRASTPLPVVYYAFDVLSLEDQDITKRPLEDRRDVLARVVVCCCPSPCPARFSKLKRPYANSAWKVSSRNDVARSTIQGSGVRIG